MGIESIVRTSQKYFHDVVKNGVVDEASIYEYLKNVDNVDRRVKIISEYFNLILTTNILSKVTLQYITSGKSYSEVAAEYNLIHMKDDDFKEKTAEAVKSDVAYGNKKLNRYFAVVSNKRNFLNLMFSTGTIPEYNFKVTEEAMRMVKAHYADNIFNNKSFLLNIPAFSYKNNLSDNSFKKVKELIRPYIINQRKIAQTKLNKMQPEAGYLRYIMQKDIHELNEVDIDRRNELLELFNEADKEQFKIDNSNREKEIKNTIKDKYMQEKDKLFLFDKLTDALKRNDEIKFKQILKEIRKNYIQNLN